MLRGDSSAPNRIIWNVSGTRSTSAREVIISDTNRPPPCSRHNVRKPMFVMPAMGASTTGGQTSNAPTFTRSFSPLRTVSRTRSWT